MAKVVQEGGKVYRIRRGVLVEIPEKWVGKIPTRRTMRKRKSFKENLKKKGGR